MSIKGHTVIVSGMHYSAFTNFAECFFANIFITLCLGHMGFSPLNLESVGRLSHAIFSWEFSSFRANQRKPFRKMIIIQHYFTV